MIFSNLVQLSNFVYPSRVWHLVYCLIIFFFKVSIFKPSATLYTCKSVTDPHYSVLDPNGQGRLASILFCLFTSFCHYVRHTDKSHSKVSKVLAILSLSTEWSVLS